MSIVYKLEYFDVFSNVEPQHQGTAGMMAAFFLILGIFSGVLFSLPVTLIIENVG